MPVEVRIGPAQSCNTCGVAGGVGGWGVRRCCPRTHFLTLPPPHTHTPFIQVLCTLCFAQTHTVVFHRVLSVLSVAVEAGCGTQTKLRSSNNQRKERGPRNGSQPKVWGAFRGACERCRGWNQYPVIVQPAKKFTGLLGVTTPQISCDDRGDVCEMSVRDGMYHTDTTDVWFR